ncbi:MAG: hypothetical protein ACI8XW_003370, partial [Gammaproteobacteria bacterium]
CPADIVSKMMKLIFVAQWDETEQMSVRQFISSTSADTDIVDSNY